MQNFSQYLNYALIIISAAVAIVSIVYKIKSGFMEVIIKFIKDAEEDTTLTGPQKMDLVISWLRNLVPRLFKVVFTDQVLRTIAQNIYDDLKAYRESYLKNLTGGDLQKLLSDKR
jgi:hypothetical protein